MRVVLIVSPHYPPVSAPDMHRVRMSMPYFAEFGWRPVVLSVEPAYVERIQEPLLLESVPPGVPVSRVKALPARWTRKVGFSDVGLRSLPFLYSAGAEAIRKHRADLVYFSTTMFVTMSLGRLWQMTLGTPYLIDLQDPWVGDYYEERSAKDRPPKYRRARAMHKLLESWTMGRVGGVVAVSDAYHVSLRARYPRLAEGLCRTIPFGAASLDYDIAARSGRENLFFEKGDGLLHGVYAGVLGRVMKQTCVAICAALRKGLESHPELFERVRLHFVGTDYANDARAAKTIQPIAAEMGVGQYVSEETGRIPYFETLRLLKEADFLLVPGSDDPHYTASKIYPYIMAGRPMLAIFHEQSSVVRVLRETRAGELVTFSSDAAEPGVVDALTECWAQMLRRLPFRPPTDWETFERYTAREMTRRQCELFDRVLRANGSRRRAQAAADEVAA